MADFTTEALVRLRFQLNDTTLVPTTLIDQAIDDAHTELLRFLDPDVDTVTPEDALVMGETLLAGSNALRMLASSEAFGQKKLSIGGRRIEESDRFKALSELADISATQAWYILEPYAVERPSKTPAGVTDTTPVLGEE